MCDNVTHKLTNPFMRAGCLTATYTGVGKSHATLSQNAHARVPFILLYAKLHWLAGECHIVEQWCCSIDIYKKPRCPTSYTTHVKIRSGS